MIVDDTSQKTDGEKNPESENHILSFPRGCDIRIATEIHNWYPMY